jgi:hypothetical protein
MKKGALLLCSKGSVTESIGLRSCQIDNSTLVCQVLASLFPVGSLLYASFVDVCPFGCCFRFSIAKPPPVDIIEREYFM